MLITLNLVDELIYSAQRNDVLLIKYLDRAQHIDSMRMQANMDGK